MQFCESANVFLHFIFTGFFLEPKVMPVEETVPVTIVPESKQQPTPKGIHNNCPCIVLICCHIDSSLLQILQM